MQFGRWFRLPIVLAWLFCVLPGAGVVPDCSALADTRAANQSPVIVNVSAVIYWGYVFVTGNVLDPDDNPAGWTLYFTGDVEGTTTVRQNGTFGFVRPYTAPYGEAAVDVWDPHGSAAETVYFDFQE